MKMTIPKQCIECGGKLKKQTITYTQPWGDQLYRFEGVPALVCQQCGFIWLSAETSQLIDEIIQQREKPQRYERVPVFSFPKFSDA